MSSVRQRAIQQAVTSLRATVGQKKPAKPFRVEKLGIEVVAIRLTANGHMLDFRYRVLDPEKAKPMFDKKIKPYLIDLASGAKMEVPMTPKLGALRQTPPTSRAGQVYFSFFANPGKLVKAGNKVTVVYGEYKIENLVAE